MPEWAQQALVSGAVGLIIALAASWFNKIAYREQIAESELTSGLFTDAKAVWGAVIATRVRTEQLLARVDYECKLYRQSMTEDELLARLNEFYEPESRDILAAVGQLGRYYVSLPSPAVNALREYEEIVFLILRHQKIDRAPDLVHSSERIFRELRRPISEVVRRRRKMLDILSEPVDGGIVPTYVRTAMGLDGRDVTPPQVANQGSAPPEA